MQDQNTCAVFGIPRAALKLGAAQLILAQGEIALAICEEAGYKPKIQTGVVKGRVES
jgi:chemotaxis response regulator CheB